MGFFLFLAYLAATFIRPFELFPELIQFRPMLLLGGVALLVALLSRAVGGVRLTSAPELLLIPLLIIWAAFSVLITTKWLTAATDTVVTLSANLFIYYLLVLNLDTLRRVRITLHLLTFLAVVVAIESISAYHFGYRREELIIYETAAGEPAELRSLDDEDAQALVARIRHRGVLADPNDLAQTLIALMPFVFLARSRGSALHNLVRVWLPISIMGYAVFLTRSRGGGVAVMALLFLALRERFRAAYSMLLTGMGAFVLLGLGIFAGRTVGMDASAGSRTAAWRSGWAMLKASPIWGVGFGAFTEHHERAAHNSLVQCFAELGLVGYFLWLGTLVVTFWALFQVRGAEAESGTEVELSRLARAGILSLTSFLVASFFLSRTYQVMLFLLVGMATAIADIARRRRMNLRPMTVWQWFKYVSATVVLSIVLLYGVMRVAP